VTLSGPLCDIDVVPRVDTVDNAETERVGDDDEEKVKELVADDVAVDVDMLHVAFEIAPIISADVPAGQGIGFRELNGQYELTGQMTGVPDMQ
jgi:hypothetical protein